MSPPRHYRSSYSPPPDLHPPWHPGPGNEKHVLHMQHPAAAGCPAALCRKMPQHAVGCLMLGCALQLAVKQGVTPAGAG
jgi:hypothetical protein